MLWLFAANKVVYIMENDRALIGMAISNVFP